MKTFSFDSMLPWMAADGYDLEYRIRLLTGEERDRFQMKPDYPFVWILQIKSPKRTDSYYERLTDSDVTLEPRVFEFYLDDVRDVFEKQVQPK